MRKNIIATLILLLTSTICFGQVDYSGFYQVEEGIEIGDLAPEINLPDKDGNLIPLYNVSAIPASFLIDENGIIIAKNLRGKNLFITLEDYTERRY